MKEATDLYSKLVTPKGEKHIKLLHIRDRGRETQAVPKTARYSPITVNDSTGKACGGWQLRRRAFRQRSHLRWAQTAWKGTGQEASSLCSQLRPLQMGVQHAAEGAEKAQGSVVGR